MIKLDSETLEFLINDLIASIDVIELNRNIEDNVRKIKIATIKGLIVKYQDLWLQQMNQNTI
jgi:hypothetical protein